jgi:hypothetical protein
MKFHLKLLGLFEIDIETPAVEQVSSIDIVSACLSAISQIPMFQTMMMVTEDEDEN